jgi:hypothetical protein
MHIIITLYNECTVQLLYYISSNGLLDECDKAENLEVTGAAITSCLGKKIVKLKTNPVLCKIVRL